MKYNRFKYQAGQNSFSSHNENLSRAFKSVQKFTDNILMSLFNAKVFISSILFSLISCFAYAFDVPNFHPNVVDTSGTLSQNDIYKLNQKIEQIRNDSHIFAAILLVPSLGGESIEAAAEKTFREWKLGQEKVNNGLLIIAAIQDRKVRIEVGYGLEGSLTDVTSHRIIDQIIVPNFKKRKFAEGLEKSLNVANEVVKTGDSIKLRKAPWLADKFKIVVLLWVFLIIGLPFLYRRKMVARAQCYPIELQPTESESSFWAILLGPIWIITLFLLINPGVFFIMISTKTQFWWLSPIFIPFAYVFLFATNTSYLSMRSEKARRELYDKLRNKSFEKLTSSADIWNSNFRSSGSRSGFSSRGGGGFSSSSGGGRSGGGGASGSW